MPKKNFDFALKNMDGSIAIVGDKEILAKDMVIEALLAPDEKLRKVTTGIEKAKRSTMAHAIYAGGEQDLKPEDITMIKDLVGIVHVPLVVGQLYDYLDS